MKNPTTIPPLWKNYRIFDAHTHIGLYDFTGGGKFLLKDLESYMETYNISYSAVSSVTKNWKMDNDDVAEAMKKMPGKIIGLAHIDPTAGEAAIDEINRCLALGFTGLKLHPQMDAWNLCDDLVFPVLEKASKHKLPILIHTGTPPFTTPIHVGFLGQRFPDIRFICGHMGIVDSAWEAIPAGKMADNVYMELSGAVWTAVVEKAIKTLGADRFVWGTDQPCLTFESEFYRLLSLRIEEEAKEKILFDNAKRLYGVK